MINKMSPTTKRNGIKLAKLIREIKKFYPKHNVLLHTLARKMIRLCWIAFGVIDKAIVTIAREE